jgi:hypothetical protein
MPLKALLQSVAPPFRIAARGLDAQIEALQAAGCDLEFIYREKVSSVANRPKLDEVDTSAGKSCAGVRNSSLNVAPLVSTNRPGW